MPAGGCWERERQRKLLCIFCAVAVPTVSRAPGDPSLLPPLEDVEDGRRAFVTVLLLLLTGRCS